MTSPVIAPSKPWTLRYRFSPRAGSTRFGIFATTVRSRPNANRAFTLSRAFRRSSAEAFYTMTELGTRYGVLAPSTSRPLRIAETALIAVAARQLLLRGSGLLLPHAQTIR